MRSSRLQNTIEYLGGPYDGRTEPVDITAGDLHSYVRLPLPLDDARVARRIFGRPSVIRFAAYALECQAGRNCYRYVGRETPGAIPSVTWRKTFVRWLLGFWE